VNVARDMEYDRVAAEYAKHRSVHPGVVQHLLSDCSLGPSSRVLEIGCGTANYLEAIQHAKACACTGLDPSEAMLAKGQARGLRASLLRGTAEKLPFPAASFDLVFTVDVIHHVADRLSSYREARRVLAHGGRVLTATDSEDIIRRRAPLAVYFPETVEVDLARYPPIEQLRALMSVAGFTAIQEATVEFAWEATDVDAYRDKAFSCLHKIPPDAFERGIQRLEADLRRGPIPCVSRYLLLSGSR
jgi:ubiquinone/menaquinone biosynthesis C-methylase UbiE